MFLLSKILLKFTPKLNKLHLITITLFNAHFNTIYSKLHHLFFSQTPKQWLGYNIIIFVQ